MEQLCDLSWDNDDEELTLLQMGQKSGKVIKMACDIEQICDISNKSKRHPNDGCGRPSPVIVHAPKMTKEWQDMTKQLVPFATRLQELAEQSGLLQEMKSTPPAKWTDDMFDSKLELIEDEIPGLIGSSMSVQELMQVEAGQPMRLNLTREIGRAAQDIDLEGVVLGGCPVYLDETPPSSGVWPTKQESKYDATKALTIWDENYRSVTEQTGRFRREIDRQLEAEISKGWIQKMPPGEKPLAMGILACVYEGEREQRDEHGEQVPKLRLPYDSKVTSLNSRVNLHESVELPGPEELDSSIEYYRDYVASGDAEALTEQAKPQPGLTALKLDFTKAFRQIAVKEQDQVKLGMVHDGVYFKRARMIEGYALAGWHWQRHSSVFIRSFKKILAAAFEFYVLLYFVDDILVIMKDEDSLLFSAMLCLLLRLVRAPVSWGKTKLDKQVSWVGYQYDLKNFSRGVPDDKHQSLCKQLVEFLEIRDGRLDYLSFQKFVCRMGWLSRINPYLKPFLKRAYGQLAQIRRQFEKKKKSLRDAYIRKFKVQDDLPVWCWLLANRKTVDIPLSADHFGTRYKADAYGVALAAGVGGWMPIDEAPCEDCQDVRQIKWFSEVIKKGDWKAYANQSMQSLISPMEAFAQYLCMRLWGISGKYYFAATDSMVSTWALGRWKSKSMAMTDILRLTSFWCLKYSVYPCVRHEEGIANTWADHLSRAKRFMMSIVQDQYRERLDVVGILNEKLELAQVQDDIDAIRQIARNRSTETNLI